MITSHKRQLVWVGSLVISGFILGQPSSAQVVRDGTLSTQVNRVGDMYKITQGNQVGKNLFHSFSEFSLPTGGEAFFDNTTSITHIFGRVTGANPSVIDGLIRANGNASLTLINPNGMTFGANARLEIGGSFIGSSASSLEFADGTEFSAIAPNASPLLSVSAPIGLQFQQFPGPIRVQGDGHNLTAAVQIFSPFARGEVAGLKVRSGKTLALVGGEVDLDGGTLSADSGRIEVGGVRQGRVQIRRSSLGWRLGYQDVQAFQDITFRQEALADASGTGSGAIQLQGQNIAVNRGSIILSQTQGKQDSLGIEVKASESITLRGTKADGSLSGGLFTETLNAGKGGDIKVTAPNVVVQNGAAIFTGTFTNAPGGNISVRATESLQVLGFSRITPSRFSNISATTFGSGPAGSLTVNTGTLTARNGGNIASVTGGLGGTGKGGDVVINARDSIELLGVTPTTLTPSQITAGTGGAGDAGSVRIKTRQLLLRNGGRVDASTLAGGAAGSVTINASESVEVRGRVPGSLNPSLINSSANIVDSSLQTLLRLPKRPTGSAGSLEINTPRLAVVEGGQVTVRNDGTGDAGTLKIQSKDLVLRDQGRLSASTITGQGGDITIKTRTLTAQQDSEISAEAGGSGMGGNISITGVNQAESVVLSDNSDITANAFMGSGGNIRIETRGLFPCSTCNISASSQLGVDGIVRFITPETDTTREGINLVEEIIDPEAIVVQACSAYQGLARSELTITGRGGVAPRPDAPLTSEVVVSFASAVSAEQEAAARQSASIQNPTATLPPPAQGLLIDSQGNVSLIAQVPQGSAGRLQMSQVDCHSS